MTKRYARKSPSKKSSRIASSDTLNALEQKVMAIAEQLGRIAATAQEKPDVGLNQPAFQSQLAEIRARTSRLLERFRMGSPSADGRERAREQSRKKVAAPGKKHRKAREAAHGVKHSDELISKELTTRRRRNGRPREG